MTRKTSMKDIAKQVGVSTALVSYVLNGLEKEKRVSPEVVKKIQKAADELNYKPNQLARSLRKGITNTIGLVVADISNPFFGQLARIIEDEAASRGYRVIFGSSDESSSKSKDLIETLLNRQVDGLIITPAEGNSGYIKSLVLNDVPLVLVDRYFPDVSTNYVALNNYEATYSALKYLVEKGYKKISMIVYKTDLIHMQERIRGYQEAMSDAGLAENTMLEKITYGYAKEEMAKLIDNLLSNRKIDAIIFSTNALSITGLYSIRNKNIKVPNELGLIGFDGHEVFDFFQPPLSYIQQPINEMGKEAVNILINQIKGNRHTFHIRLRHKLVIRESCR